MIIVLLREIIVIKRKILIFLFMTAWIGNVLNEEVQHFNEQSKKVDHLRQHDRMPQVRNMIQNKRIEEEKNREQYKEIDQKIKEKFGVFRVDFLSKLKKNSSCDIKKNSSCDIMQMLYDIKGRLYMQSHKDEKPSTSELIITEIFKCVFKYITGSNKKPYC